MRRFLFTAAIAVGLLALGAGTASAVDYPARAGVLLVSARTDSGVTIAGCGYAAGTAVQIQVDSADDGTTHGTDVGCIRMEIALARGAHVVTATGLDPTGGTLVLTARLSDPGTGTGSDVSSLPFTGSNSLLVGGIALAMLAVGALFTVVTRRRSADRPRAQA